MNLIQVILNYFKEEYKSLYNEDLNIELDEIIKQFLLRFPHSI